MNILVRRLVCGLFALLAGCVDSGDSSPNPLLRTGRDARVYNPMTGRYEWPDESGGRRPRTRARPAAHAAPRPSARDDRAYNPQTGRFEAPSQQPRP